MLTLLKELCQLNGTSSREDAVRSYIIDKIKDIPTVSCRVDAMGNLLIHAKGKQKAKNKVMLEAHMDEVGLIATFITEEGLIRFHTVGSIQSAVLSGRAVLFENGVKGVIGIKPVHLCTADEKVTLPSVENLYIDIGCTSKDEALSHVLPGDTAVFYTPFTDMGEKIASKALDDRIGCAVMLYMLLNDLEYDADFAFTVQEEVGLRGASAAAYSLAPQYAVVLEGTTAADLPDVAPKNRVCEQGKGAVISFMDKATVYSPALYKRVLKIAGQNGIPAQVKTMVAGGNDAGSIHKTLGGIQTVTLNVPCRYIHSPSSVAQKSDILALHSLAQAVLKELACE